MRVNVVGMRLKQRARRGLGIVHPVSAEVKIRQIVAQLGGIRIGIEGKLVLFNGLVHLVGMSLGDGVILIYAGQGQVKVSLGAIRLCRRRVVGR